MIATLAKSIMVYCNLDWRKRNRIKPIFDKGGADIIGTPFVTD